ncbi:metal-dependent transcriptional regulator [Streptomyces sp. NPDC059906]|uniref:metal-dependent transcriptional regulator n=1 Tax=Streptomyces sp. NPDC059906 TaxID=3346997 RepID=UPI003651681D
MSRLIDTTEMYLRTVLELEEEGVVPLRARIAEHLDQSGPTVSQTVARMERDGLLRIAADWHLELTDTGRRLATRVMRKHRLAECLLVDVIGLEWEQVHAEACRWEHVMSEAVERRLLRLLRHPTESPYGNPIPGLEELGGANPAAPRPSAAAAAAAAAAGSTVSLGDLLPGPDGVSAVVRRIGEPVQADGGLLSTLRRAGVRPGAVVSVRPWPGGVTVGNGDRTARLPARTAAHVFVAPL